MTLTGLRSGILDRVITWFLKGFGEDEGVDFSDLAEFFTLEESMFSCGCFLEDIIANPSLIVWFLNYNYFILYIYLSIFSFF